MAVAKTIHGARVRVKINGKSVGFFNSVTWGLNNDVQPLYILGRFSPAELVVTGQEAISLTATGFRIIDLGPHVVCGLPHLQDLLQDGGLVSLSVEDRITGKNIALVEDAKTAGYNTSVNARGVEELTVNWIGSRLSDESGPDAEGDAANITDFA